MTATQTCSRYVPSPSLCSAGVPGQAMGLESLGQEFLTTHCSGLPFSGKQDVSGWATDFAVCSKLAALSVRTPRGDIQLWNSEDGVILIMPRFFSVHLSLGDFGQEPFNISESYFLICKMRLIVASPMRRVTEVLYKMSRLGLERG